MSPLQGACEQLMSKHCLELSITEETAACKQDKEKGQGSLFNAVPKLIEQQDKGAGEGPVIRKKVHTEVCLCH